MPKISVIMPVYNTLEDYLREAIESILNQTFQDFELLIIDDCSTKIDVKSYINIFHDERIIYLKTSQNSGASGARNYGLLHAKGEFIAILDSDDIALPQRFEKQIAYLDQHPHVGVLGSWAAPFPYHEFWKPQEHFTYLDIVKFSPFLIHSTIMMRKSVLDISKENYNPDYEMGEDYYLWSRLVRYTQIANIQEVLVKYRMGYGMSFTSQDRMIAQTHRIQQEMLEYLTSDVEMQNKIRNMLMPSKKIRSPLKRRIKYNLYKGLWILGGKGNFLKTKMEKTKRKMKGL